MSYPGQQYKQQQQQYYPQQGYAPPPGPPNPYGHPQQPPYQNSPYAPPSGPPPSQQAYGYAPPPNAPPPGYGHSNPYGHPQQSPYAPPSGPPQSHYAPPMGPPPAHNYSAPPPTGQMWAPPPGMNTGPYGYGAGSSCTGTKKAMFVGINYFGTSSKLSGCINDVKNVKAFITRNYGFREDPNLMLTLTDDQQGWQFRPTRANIIAGIRWLVQGARPGDSLFFHFSGHGSQQKDHDGDEDDGYDETICPLDYQTAGMITDDELNQMLVRPLPAGVRLTCVVDSCHSGSVLDLPFMYLPDGTVKDASLLKKAGGLALGVGMKMLKRDKIGAAMQLFQGVSQLATGGNSKKMEGQKGSPADVFMFSGCKDSQTSADTYKQGVGSTGAMSYSLLKALGTNPRQTYAQLLGAVRDILRNEYQQIPQMSTAHLTDMNQPFNM